MILQPDSTEFRAMLQGYAGCLLWTMPGADGDDTPGDRFTWERFTHCARMVCIADCLEFLAHVDRAGLAPMLRDIVASPGGMREAIARASREGAYTWASLGHDVALSRNGHGAGFFDRDALTEWETGLPGSDYRPHCLPRDRFTQGDQPSRNLGDALQWIAEAMGERDIYAARGWIHAS